MAIIHALQSIQLPGLLPVMKIFTFLGSETFYLFILPVLIWCWRQDIVRPLVIVVLLNFMLNFALKEAFALPRPPAYLHWTAASGYGFPSGHAQGAMVLFGYLGWTLKQYWWPALLILGIGLSRIYLGVHYPHDVVGGWTIGFMVLVVAIAVVNEIRKQSLVINAIPVVFISVFVGGMIPVLLPREFTVQIGGLFAGITAGLVLVQYYLPFNPAAAFGHQVVKVVVGMGGLWLLRSGFLSVTPDWNLMNWVIYLLIGLWIGGGVPWCAVQLGWQKERPAPGLEAG